MDRWVVVGCPPGVELARSRFRAECDFVKRVLEDLKQIPGREYLVLPTTQWDEEE